MSSDRSIRSGITKLGFLIGAVLWLAILGILMLRVTQRDPAVPEQSADTEPRGRAHESGATSEAAGSDSSQPPAVVLQPSENSVRIGFPAKELPDFEFQECMGGTVSRDSLKGKPWVAIFVFTRCVTTCPVISRQMMQLQKRVPDPEVDVKFVTFTVDPKFDTATVLQQYSEVYSADHDRWKFLTGDEAEIHNLIREGFAQVVIPTIGDERKPGYEVAHSNRVVLVNEDSIPVATYLATRDEDIVKLRRVLEGKDPFPQPAPISGLTFSSSPQAPLNLDIRKSEPAESPPSGDQTEEPNPDSSPDGSNDNSENATPPSATQAPADSSGPGDEPAGADSSTAAEPQGTSASRIGEHQPVRLVALAAGMAMFPAVASWGAVQLPFSQTTEADVTPDRTPAAADANAAIDQLLPSWAARLPRLNAVLNSISTLLLISGFCAIKKQRPNIHRNLMIGAFLVSVAFLASYLTYHYALGQYTGEHGRRFVGSPMAGLVYKSILVPHVILAALVPLLAIRVFQHAFAGRWDKHRRLARFTLPIWLFVSVTGVVIYWMLYEWPWTDVHFVPA